MDLFNLLFSFKGRINRLEFLLGVIISLSIAMFFVMLPALFDTIDLANQLIKLLTIFSYVIGIGGYLIINLIIGAKRLRDLQWPLWLTPLFIVPTIGIVMQLLGMLVPGKYNTIKTTSRL